MLTIPLCDTAVELADSANQEQLRLHMDFAQVVDDYSSKSFRLLAMAMGTIQHATELNLAHMTPQQVEASASNMRLLSLIVLTNNVRPDSSETIAHLQDGCACPFGLHGTAKTATCNFTAFQCNEAYAKQGDIECCPWYGLRMELSNQFWQQHMHMCIVAGCLQRKFPGQPLVVLQCVHTTDCKDRCADG